jgi:cysteine-rich repeat protein
MEVCGDGLIGPNEGCDDGNVVDDDGCSAGCAVEDGAACSGEPSVCENGTCAAPFLVTSTPFELNGSDFVIYGDEGNFASGAGCIPALGSAVGPDVVFQVDLLAGDTVRISEHGTATVVLHVLEPPSCWAGTVCTASADIPEEEGTSYTATVPGPVYLAVELEEPGDFSIQIEIEVCGDGILENAEQCDDGNLASTDGCSASCEIEAGYSCTGSPSTCVALPAATCTDPILVTSTPFQFTDTNFAAYGDDADFDEGIGCVDVADPFAAGQDVVFRIDLTQGETVRLRELGSVQAVGRILFPGMCSDGVVCIASATAGLSSGITYTATAPTPVYLVIEASTPPAFGDEVDVRIDTWSCGDGNVEANEMCDDGNTTSGDGCSAVCDFETAAAALAADCTGTVHTYAPVGSLPIALLDGPLPALELDFVVPHMGTVQKAAVRVSITHPWVSDLDISLAGPGQALPGTMLSSDNGADGDNYTNTIFIEGALLAIDDGDPPFTGTFEPEGDLGGFVGTSPFGVWTLSIDDDTMNDVGVVTFAGLALCITP